MIRELDQETYWNDERHPKIIKMYRGRLMHRGWLRRATPYEQDVRTFLRVRDARLERIVTDALFVKPETPVDAILQRIQAWVISRITYVGDSKSWFTPEYWQTVDETMLLGAGDCEDGAILIASLMLHCGIAPWRVRVNAGWVQAGKGAAQGGHAYAVYCDGEQWYPIDWCYLPEVSEEIKQRRPLKQIPEYQDVWWSFNNVYAWSDEDPVAFEGRVRDV